MGFDQFTEAKTSTRDVIHPSRLRHPILTSPSLAQKLPAGRGVHGTSGISRTRSSSSGTRSSSNLIRTLLHLMQIVTVGCAVYGIVTVREHLISEWSSLTHRISVLEDLVHDLQDQINARVARQRDFALRGTGAYILEEFTTATFSPPMRKYFQWGTANQISAPILPIAVLDDQVEVGECWEFKGASGHIAIVLSERVVVSEMVVTYADQAILPSTFVLRAPRHLTLWGLLDESTVVATSVPRNETRPIRDFLTAKHLSSRFNPSDSFIPLIRGNFSVYRPSESQMEKAGSWVEKLAIEIVVMEVQGNWGANTTCLHHLAIHGDP